MINAIEPSRFSRSHPKALLLLLLAALSLSACLKPKQPEASQPPWQWQAASGPYVYYPQPTNYPHGYHSAPNQGQNGAPQAASYPGNTSAAAPNMHQAAPPAAQGAEPAGYYANLSAAQVRQLILERGLPILPVENSAAKQVAIPVKLNGPLNGVLVVMNGSKVPGSQGHLDILDGRLALAVADWARGLAARGVTVVHHASLLRPGAVIRSSGKPSQHGLGLAIDIAKFSLSDGRALNVKEHFSREMGKPVCEPQSSPEAVWLRGVACEAYRGRAFHILLTPNYNQDHHDHFHFDLQPNKSYFQLK